MKNTLKYVLIVVGCLLMGYGIISFFYPDILMYSGALPVEGKGFQRQSLAILGLGILALLAGLAFARK